MANKKKKSPVQTATSNETLNPNVSKAKAEKPVKDTLPPQVEQELTFEVMTMIPTSDPDLFRYADQNGDWQFYYVKSLDIFVPATSRILSYGWAKGKGFYEYLLGTDKQSAKEMLESRGNRGSRVHEAIRWLEEGKRIDRETKFESRINGRYEVLTPDEWRFVCAWTKWVKKCEPKTIFFEQSFYRAWYVKTGATPANAKYPNTLTIPDYRNLSEVERIGYRLRGFAGTIDWYGEIGYKGRRVLAVLDWKTSSKINDEYKGQTACYSRFVPPHAWNYTGVVQLKLGRFDTDEPFEMKLWDRPTTEKHYRAFEGAMDIHDIATRAEEYDPREDQEHLPVSLQVNIEQIKVEPSEPVKPEGSPITNKKIKKSDVRKKV